MANFRVASQYLHLPRTQLMECMLTDYRTLVPSTEGLEFQKFCASIAIVVDSGYFQVSEAMRSAAWDAFVCREQSDKLAAFTKYLRLMLQLVHKAQFEPLPQEEYFKNINQTSYLHAFNVKTDLDLLRKRHVDVYALETFFRTHHFWSNVDQAQVPMPEYGTSMLIYTRGNSEISQKGFFLFEKLNYLSSFLTGVNRIFRRSTTEGKQRSSPPVSPTHRDDDCIFQPAKIADEQLRDIIKRKGLLRSLFSSLEVQHPTYLEVLVMTVRKTTRIHALDDIVNAELFANIPVRDLSMVLPEPTILLPPWDRIVFFAQITGLLVAFYTTYQSLVIETSEAGEGTWQTIIVYGSVLFACLMKVWQLVYGYITCLHYYSREVLKWRSEHSVCSGTAFLSHLHHEVREQELKEILLCYYIMLSATSQTHFSTQQIDTLVERFLCDTFGVEFNFDVKDAVEKLVSLGLVTLQAGKGYQVSCKPTKYLDTTHPRWIDFFHSFLRVPPPPATT